MVMRSAMEKLFKLGTVISEAQRKLPRMQIDQEHSGPEISK